MTFAESIGQASKQALCGVIDTFEGLSAMNDLTFGRIPGPLPSATNFWRGLNRRVCDKDEPGGAPPGSGGQCPCVRYRVETNIERQTLQLPDNKCGVGTPVAGSRDVYGPVTSVFIRKTNSSSTSWGIYAMCRGLTTNDPGGAGCRASIVERQLGTFSSSATGTDGPCPEPQLLSYRMIRIDGQPEQDCDREWNPPPPPRDWNKVVINNFTWITNNGDTINEGDANFEFGFAYIDLDADFKIPVKVDVGGISFNGNFNFDKGAFEFDFSRDIINNNGGDVNIRNPDNDGRELPDSDPDAPDRIDDVEPDPDVIEDDEREDDDTVERSRIVAARVVVNQTGNFVDELFQNRNPNIAIPNYGYIQFFIQTGETEGGWTADIPVKNKNHYIPCPVPEGALFVRGTPRNGVNWSIQAYRKRLEGKVTFPT